MESSTHQHDFRDCVTGNVSAPRERILALGGFDARFAGYGREDYELGYRLQRAGMRFVYEPRAVGLHRYRKPLTSWLRQSRSIGHADVLFARLHPEIAGEVMTLSSYPFVPFRGPLVAIAEAVAHRRNRAGGWLWKKAAAYAQSAHYWSGIRDAVDDRAELAHLLRVQQERKSRAGRISARKRAYMAYAQWALR